MSERFNAREHLRQFTRRQRQEDGSYKPVSVDYLDVKWRIVWFRAEHPDGVIETELLSPPGTSPAVVKATVTVSGYLDRETGSIEGEPVTVVGHGQCSEDDWSNYLEKAETRAIGRALALLGYGTQFCEDFTSDADDEPGDDQEVEQPAGRRQRAPRQQAGPTLNQMSYIHRMRSDLNMSKEDLDAYAEERWGSRVSQLSRMQASDLIEWLKGQTRSQD